MDFSNLAVPSTVPPNTNSVAAEGALFSVAMTTDPRPQHGFTYTFLTAAVEETPPQGKKETKSERVKRR